MINRLEEFSLHYLLLKMAKEQNRLINEGLPLNQNIIDKFGIIGKTSNLTYKGGRFAGKTVATATEIVEEMIKDKNSSKIVLMPLIKDHTTKTIRAIGNAIESMDKKVKGTKFYFRRVMDKSQLRYELNWPDGHKQEVRFLSMEEVHSAGDEPLPNTHFDLIWAEELVSSAERSKTDYDEKELLLQGIDVLKNTIIRHTPDNKDIIEIYTFNPYNKGEPLLAAHNKYLPDNKKQLEDYGFDWKYVPELETLLITSNYHQNIYLKKKAWLKMQKDKELNPDEYDITGLGISGSPTKYQFAHIRPIIDKHERYLSDLNNVTIISGGMDIGESKARTSIGLFLYDNELRAYTTWDIHTYKPDNKFTNQQNHLKNINIFLHKMLELRNEYFFDYSKITFYCDGAAGEFISAYHKIKPIFEQKNKVKLNWLNVIAFPEHVKKSGEWRIEERQRVWEGRLTRQALIISPLNDKPLYDEIVNLPLDENGKRSKEGDDAINRAEMSMGKWFIPFPKKKVKVMRG